MRANEAASGVKREQNRRRTNHPVDDDSRFSHSGGMCGGMREQQWPRIRKTVCLSNSSPRSIEFDDPIERGQLVRTRRTEAINQYDHQSINQSLELYTDCIRTSPIAACNPQSHSNSTAGTVLRHHNLKRSSFETVRAKVQRSPSPTRDRHATELLSEKGR